MYIFIELFFFFNYYRFYLYTVVFWTSFLALWRNVLKLSILVENFHFCSRIKFKSENFWGGLEPPPCPSPCYGPVL